jgi:gliding motility-associated-like protein
MEMTGITTGRTVGTKSKGVLLALYIGLSLGSAAQCDLELVGVDLIEGTVTVSFNNTENCGGTGGPDGISEIQFGFQALDENCNAMNVGWDFPSGVSIPDDSNHPGWVYSATTTETPSNWTNLYGDDIDPPYYTGEVIDFPIYNVYQSSSGGLWYQMEDILGYWIDEGYSIQVVIWQISYGPTMYAEDGGWAEVGPNGDGSSWGSGVYDDENFLDNWVVIGPCGECVPEVVTDTVYVDLPADTVTVFESDTIIQYDTTYTYITDTLYLVDVDTSYITLIDTVYLTDYQTDTVIVVDIDTSYISLTDTIYVTEYQIDTTSVYEYDMVEVDCSTGQPCVSPFSDCSIYIPNSFTPNNDGVNDVWGAETDSFCWASWRMKVFSRTGELVWESYDPDDIWLGGDEYYVPNDMYIYRVECEGYGESYIINGHVTIIR